MKRIYEPHAYGPLPMRDCYWSTTLERETLPQLHGSHKTDVAIIGGGFTGLNAALHLAEDGVDVTLLDAQYPGWGASGRNGGFCCLGGGVRSNAQLDKSYGQPARRDWRQAEKDAIAHVASLLARFNIEADVHSQGETLLAHKPAKWDNLQRYADDIADSYGTAPQLIAKQDLAEHGLCGPFHGALTVPVGFALNPQKYATGLVRASTDAGATLFERSPVTGMSRENGFTLHSPQGTLHAKRIIVATNGYSSEDIPPWLAARFMPVQSSVIVTRPLTDTDLRSAGWTSGQMAYDTRNLLHYFRLMPDRRFLFGMRGGIFATRRSETHLKRLIRSDFETMFPAWRHVETPYHWTGLVSLNAKGLPYVGPVPDMPNVFTAGSYHGNGVAMASYCGTLLADLVQGKPTRLPLPEVLGTPPGTFPLGQYRRWLLKPAYAFMGLQDL